MAWQIVRANCWKMTDTEIGIWGWSFVCPTQLPWRGDRNWLLRPRLYFHVSPALHDYDIHLRWNYNIYSWRYYFVPREDGLMFLKPPQIFPCLVQSVMMEWVVKCAAASDKWKSDPCPLPKSPDIYNLAWRQSKVPAQIFRNQHEF